MKLIKKLLPATMLGITALSVAPIASCSKGEDKKQPKTIFLILNTKNITKEYENKEKLNIDGLKVYAVSDDCNLKEIETSKCEFSPAVGSELTSLNDKVTVKYDDVERSFNINVFESMTDYETKGEVYQPTEEELKEGVTPAKATDLYFKSEKAAENIKDDVFYNLHLWTSLLDEALKLETHVKELPEAAEQVIEWLVDKFMGEANFVGTFEATGGSINNVSINYDETNKKAKLSANIIMRAKTRMVDRSHGLTDIGEFECEFDVTLKDFPYLMAYWTELPQFTEPCFGLAVDKTVLQNDANWSLSCHFKGLKKPTEGEEIPSSKDFDWNILNVQELLSEEQFIDFLQFHAYYLEKLSKK